MSKSSKANRVPLFDRSELIGALIFIIGCIGYGYAFYLIGK